MTQRFIHHLRANVIAYVALFVALGGTSYAAVSLPKNSVGTTQLRNGAVTPTKLASGYFGGRILAVTELENNGAVLKSNPKNVTTTDWNANSGGFVVFPYKIPRDCFPIATPAQPRLALTQGIPEVAAGIASLRSVEVSEDGPAQITLAMVCEH